MFICQSGMHNNVQGYSNANVCKQTYDASCMCCFTCHQIFMASFSFMIHVPLVVSSGTASRYVGVSLPDVHLAGSAPVGICMGSASIWMPAPVAAPAADCLLDHSLSTSHFFFFFFFLGYRGIVHPPSDDEGTERTWFEPEQRPRKHVPKRSVHGKQSPQGASKTFWRQDDQP